MENLDNEIQNNINSLIYQRYSNGIMELDTDKLIELIRRNFRLEVDYETLNSILSKNPHVDSISDKKIILKQDAGENVDDTSEIDKAVHQNALDAIDDHIEAEAFDLMNSIHKGDTYNSRDIMLEETDDSYLLHQSARKNNQVYMVSEIKPSAKLSESVVNCKIGTSKITIDLPLKCFMKKMLEEDLDIKDRIAGIYDYNTNEVKMLDTDEMHNLSMDDYKNGKIRFGIQPTQKYGKVCYITAIDKGYAYNFMKKVQKLFPNENIDTYNLEFRTEDGEKMFVKMDSSYKQIFENKNVFHFTSEEMKKQFMKK